MEERYALLIDADNVSAKYIKPILDELSKYGNVTYKRIYGDWTSTYNSSWKEVLLQNSITPIQYLTRLPGKTREACNQIILQLAEQGIASNVHYKPLPLLTAYKNMGFQMEDYPNSYRMFENEITLPLHTCLSDEQVSYVTEKFTEILRKNQ